MATLNLILLPPHGRWSPKHKRWLVSLVARGAASKEEVCQECKVSEEEFKSWEGGNYKIYPKYKLTKRRPGQPRTRRIREAAWEGTRFD